VTSPRELLTTTLIRKQTRTLFEKTNQNLGALSYHPEHWDETVDLVFAVINENYPDHNIPFHSRLNHFTPQKTDRLSWLWEEASSNITPLEKVELLFDLVIPSVLLDAGAGEDWKYHEERTNQTHARSEGLGVASFHLFFNRRLSHDGTLKATTKGLTTLTRQTLEEAFQVSATNPLIGVEGRLNLLHALGGALSERPGELAREMSEGMNVDALKVLDVVLQRLGPIWPSRYSLAGLPLGDCWPHPLLGDKNSAEGFVPFHKLSQWMSYSLLDCFKRAGFTLKNVEKLTGLPEYRNGGLFLDTKLLQFKNPNDLTRGLKVDDPEVIEWRAATVVLLDELATRLQKKMNKSPEDFPLACVLEGGSWWAGRKIAARLRPGGPSPVRLILDGTVF
jgi:hypothetical protein